MRIFTTAFFRLSFIGKIYVVAAAIRDLEATIGCHLAPADDEKVKKQIERIKMKAVEYGIVNKWYSDKPERWTVRNTTAGRFQLIKED